MAVTAKITSKGQITLPKYVRKLLDVHAGSVVMFEKEDDKIVIKSAKTIKDYKGFLNGKPADFDVVRKKAKEYVGRKAAHNGEL